MKMLIDTRKLDLYLKLNYNVLFAGRPGVGKTSIIFEAAKRAGLKVKYFSAPTMDPWVDLVGVPKNVMIDMNNSQVEVLDLIPPKDFIINQYDIIFIDEFNRAPPKVTNALMELMQFKTINGRPLDIKMVWAAINPFTEEGDFHVEKLDPAVEDRFHIRIDLPYALDKNVIKKKHGSVADVFFEWWTDQPETVRFKLSPRRIDDSIAFYQAGGNLSDMLKFGNIAQLEGKLKSVSETITFEKALADDNQPVLKKILSRNVSKSLEKIIKSDEEIFNKVFPFLAEEWVSSQVLNYKNDSFVFDKVNALSKAGNTHASSVLSEICKTNMNSHFVISNFSKINHVIAKEDIAKIEQHKVEAEQKKADFLNDETLLIKSPADSKYVDKFIPKHHNLASFNITSLNNFYKMSNFNEIFEEYHKISKINTEDRNKFKSKLAFCIAMSGLISESTEPAKGAIAERLKSVLRKNPSTSYIFNKTSAKGEFDDMEERIQGYETHVSKILPNGLNTEDLIKVFQFATSTRTRTNMTDPFTPVPTAKKPRMK